MAVVGRKRKGGKIVYSVVTSWEGRQHWETIGTNKREAEQIDRQRKAAVKAGTYRPGQVTEAASVETYALSWVAKRTNRAADNDRSLIEGHVLKVDDFGSLRMGDARPRHVLALIDALRKGAYLEDGQKPLAEKTITLALGLVRVMFRDAVIEEVISSTPYVVPRGKLTRAGEQRQPYTPSDVAALTSSVVPERERMWALLAFFTGARCGEICGLRWGDWDESPRPLGSLRIERQYDGLDGNEKTKTGRRRIVPVHPELAAALTAWRARWSLHFLRRPSPADPIVPSSDGGHMTKSAAYKGWVRACKAAGVTNRSVHSTRHTFITLTLRAGAAEKTVLRITHNPKGTIVDVYNHRDWEEFCAAVSLLVISQPIAANSGTPCFSAPAPGLEVGRNTENTEQASATDEPGEPEEPPLSGGIGGPAAQIGAGQDFRGPGLRRAVARASDAALQAYLGTLVREVVGGR